jgi:hypothetical protein
MATLGWREILIIVVAVIAVIVFIRMRDTS